MSTWHQQQRRGHIAALYTPDPRLWKVVNDKPNEPSSAILFSEEHVAREHCNLTGGFLIPPEPRTACHD